MSRFVLASAALAAAEAGTLSITYEDCGSKHGVVTGLSPNSVQTGTTARVTGTGTIDEDVTAVNIAATVSVLGTKLTDCSGDGTSDIVCTLPLGTGSVTVPALPFPLAKGTLTLPVVVTTSSVIPASLANVDIHLTAADQNGESAICLDVHTAASLASGSGACTSDEEAALADPQNVGTKANTCGTSSYNILTGKFNHDKFNSCFSASIGISETCAECYAATGEYGAKNCKADCLLGWCKSGCLSCTEPAQETLATCTGFTAGTADPCEEELDQVAVTGACTSDEQTALADPQNVGTKANTCGTSSYNILTGKFNHDKFNTCFSASIGISETCAECYAATGEYGAKNCKADCLLGWCKSGCLSCTEPAQETLATCTGFTAATADPCEEKAQGFLATV